METDVKMLRLLFASVALLSVGINASAEAQTYDDLLQENRRLHDRIRSLEQLANFRDDDDHQYGHGHAENHPTLEEGKYVHQAWHGKGHCEPHFDYSCPFKGHRGGHGHCDLCACSSSFGGDGNGHEHGHAHGPAYHHSIDGYPLLHAPRTEFFFVERHLHFVLADTRDADDGEVDELEFEAEITYALNDRFVLIGAVPVIYLNPDTAPSTTGVGDLEFGLRLMAFNGERDGLLFGLNVTAPTGDPDRDLGGDTLLLPSANWVHDFGCGTYMFNVVTWETPVGVDQPEDLFLYDFVLLHTFLGTHDARLFRYLTPSLEINTAAVINGPASGRTVVDATVGLTFVVGDESEVSLGWGVPLSGSRNFDHQFLFNFIKHL